MQQFYMSEYMYYTIINKIEHGWEEIRDWLDEIPEDDYTKFELWWIPTNMLEEWLDENRELRIEDGKAYYDLKKLDQVITLYQEAQSYTGRLYPEIENFEKLADYLTASVY